MDRRVREARRLDKEANKQPRRFSAEELEAELLEQKVEELAQEYIDRLVVMLTGKHPKYLKVDAQGLGMSLKSDDSWSGRVTGETSSAPWKADKTAPSEVTGFAKVAEEAMSASGADTQEMSSQNPDDESATVNDEEAPSTQQGTIPPPPSAENLGGADVQATEDNVTTDINQDSGEMSVVSEEEDTDKLVIKERDSASNEQSVVEPAEAEHDKAGQEEANTAEELQKSGLFDEANAQEQELQDLLQDYEGTYEAEFAERFFEKFQEKLSVLNSYYPNLFPITLRSKSKMLLLFCSQKNPDLLSKLNEFHDEYCQTLESSKDPIGALLDSEGNLINERDNTHQQALLPSSEDTLKAGKGVSISSDHDQKSPNEEYFDHDDFDVDKKEYDLDDVKNLQREVYEDDQGDGVDVDLDDDDLSTISQLMHIQYPQKALPCR